MVLMLGYNDSSVGCRIVSVRTTSDALLTGNVIRHVNLPRNSLVRGPINGRPFRLRHPVPSRAANVGLILSTLASPRRNIVHSLSRIGTINRHMTRNNRFFPRDYVIARRIGDGVHSLFRVTPLRGPTGLRNILSVRGILPKAPRIAIFSASFRRAVPTIGFVCTLPRTCCSGCHIHGCNFRNADRGCITRANTGLTKLSFRGSGVVAYRVNGNTSIATILGNGSFSASVNFSPISKLIVNAHYNGISPDTIAFVNRGRNVSCTRLGRVVGGGSNILNLASLSDSVHSVSLTCSRNGPHTVLTHSVRCKHVHGFINRCTTRVNNISVVIFANNINRGSYRVHRDIYANLRFVNIRFSHRTGGNTHNMGGVLSAPNSHIGITIVTASRRLIVTASACGLMGWFSGRVSAACSPASC